ncbi:uncharacterized protein arhgef5 isoform X2 [Misgurnus anguillicaudatus]|uniref:uncharacterized protein arhgef5 isoform X2 n=1 Tax=Misgurnus anguillicaudatus TaxID=75329 RepID=UPI003CCFA130
MDPIREKPRNGGRETRPDSYDRTRDKERLPATRGKGDEVDWRNREKRKYADRRPNGRASLAEQADYEEQENGRRKGDTFPRMTKPTKDRDGRILLPVHEREGGYRMGIPKEMLYEFERERERERRRYRDVDTPSERERTRYKEDLRRNDMRRPVKDESERRRDREKEFDSGMKDGRRESYPSVNDQWGIKERERDRRDRGDDRYRQKDREGRYYLRETESFSDREWRVERPRDTDRDKKRYTKSEGDSDEERGKDKRRKDDYNGEHKHCKSEGDSEAQRIVDRIRERDRRRDANRQREAGSEDRKGERLEHYREPERDRTRDSREKRRDYFDRDAYVYATERRRYKNEEKTRYLGQAEIEEREKRRRENREKDRPREERTSGGDVENEQRRGIREKFEERESQITSDIDKQKVEVKTEKELEGTSAPRKEEEVGSVAVKEINTDKPKSRFRKMWLEPRTLKERKDEEEYIEREKAKERYLQRYKSNTTTADVEDHEREKDREKIVSLEDRYRELEKAGEFVRYASVEQEKEKITHDREAMEPERENVEEIDKEETRGNGRYDNIGNEEGSEGESEGDKDRVMSIDDGFVTVSSGGDDAEEDDFEDCKEFWDGGVGDDQSECTQEEMTSQTVNESEDQKEPLTVFCVIGQTLPRSQTKPAFEDNTDEEATNQLSDQDLDNQGEVNVTNINEATENIEIGMNDLTLSQTEDGCDTKWEGRGSYEQPTQDVRSLDDQMIPPNEISEKDTQSVPPEPLESSEPCNNNAIVATETSSESLLKGSIGDTLEIINSDDNWYTSEERKRCSTAPHLKWAKDVVKEILGPDVTADKENTRDEDDDELCFTWSEVDLRKVSETLNRTKKRNSKFFNSQLYQEYSEVVQNREIQLSHSDSIAISGDPTPIRSSSSPNHSPKFAHRALPPPPPVPLHPYTLSQNNKSLNVPQQSQIRPPSPRLSISPSSPTLWQDLPGVRSSAELGEVTEDERRLQEVRFEVVTSEASYSRSLDIVVDNFVLSKQLKSLLSAQDKNWLFSKLSDVRDVSQSFLSKLEERVESDVMHFSVCDIIINFCPQFRKVYVPYLTNQSYQDKTYQRLMDGNHEFRRVVEKLERNPVCQRLPLRSFLILPFQRITRLKLLVQNIAKRTAPKTKDEAQAIKAMKLLEKMIQESNESISQMSNIESLVSLNAKVDFECKTLPLISQSRRLVREGPATELRDFSQKDIERNIYLHLFNDYLLVSLRKEGGKFTVIDHAPVSDLRVENCKFKLHSLKRNLFLLHMVNKSLLLRTDTEADKKRWISALSRPYPEIDFSAAQDVKQVQCIKAYAAQQPDELNLEKADVLLVHEQSSDGWVEVTRLSDRQRGWAPDSHVETIVSDKTKKRNLLDTMKIATAAM